MSVASIDVHAWSLANIVASKPKYSASEWIHVLERQVDGSLLWVGLVDSERDRPSIIWHCCILSSWWYCPGKFVRFEPWFGSSLSRNLKCWSLNEVFISVGSAFLFDIVIVDVVELGGVVFFFRRGGLCWIDNDLDISACWSLVCKE